MKKLDDFCERRFPWFVNNSIRWITQLIFLPFLLIFMTCYLLHQPFTKDFRNGGITLSWGWELLFDLASED